MDPMADPLVPAMDFFTFSERQPEPPSGIIGSRDEPRAAIS